MTHHEPNQLDQLIDRALASYVEDQPSPHLEHRVLEHIHHATNRRRRIWQLALATPLLAASVILLVFRHADETLPAPPPIASIPAAVPAPPAPTATASIAPPRMTKRTHHAAPATKEPATYLSLSIPAPALAALAHQKPEQLQALFAKPDLQAKQEELAPVTPVTIDDIDIKPIGTEPLL